MIRDILKLDRCQRGSVDEFSRLLSRRAKAYKAWAEQTLIELNESDLWTKWMLPDYPPGEQIADMAVQLNQLYRESTGLSELSFPETPEVVLELFRRGYRLGLVSNTTSSVEVPRCSMNTEITGCFETVILSAVVGKRKPDPAILLDATRRMGIRARKMRLYRRPPRPRCGGCAQGRFFESDLDTLTRSASAKAEQMDDPTLPGSHYRELARLLDIFPPRLPAGTCHRLRCISFHDVGDQNLSHPDGFLRSRAADGICADRVKSQSQFSHAGGDRLERASNSAVSMNPARRMSPADELKKRDWLISSTMRSMPPRRCEGDPAQH